MGRSGRALRIIGMRPGICGSSASRDVNTRAHISERGALTHEDDIDTTRSQGTTLGEPVPLCILLDPLVECLLLGLGEPKRRVRDALEDVVIVLGRTYLPDR